jgi:hypothetical protein
VSRLLGFGVLIILAPLLAFGQSPTPRYGVVVSEEHVTDTGSTTSTRLRSGSPEPCHSATKEVARDAINILRVEALTTQPTDGTYADEGYGQGEFQTVKLIEVLKSPVQWTAGHIFWIHPFPGKHTDQDNFAPEHLNISKTYYLLYSYYLDQEPSGESELMGLDRCGVLADTSEVRAQLIDAIHSSAPRSTTDKK